MQSDWSRFSQLQTIDPSAGETYKEQQGRHTARESLASFLRWQQFRMRRGGKVQFQTL